MKVIIIGGLIVLGAIGVFSRFVYKKTDNIVEEFIEKIIWWKTDKKVDLSPDTPDKDDKDKT